jgi:hypothetical protein
MIGAAIEDVLDDSRNNAMAWRYGPGGTERGSTGGSSAIAFEEDIRGVGIA